MITIGEAIALLKVLLISFEIVIVLLLRHRIVGPRSIIFAENTTRALLTGHDRLIIMYHVGHCEGAQAIVRLLNTQWYHKIF